MLVNILQSRILLCASPNDPGNQNVMIPATVYSSSVAIRQVVIQHSSHVSSGRAEKEGLLSISLLTYTGALFAYTAKGVRPTFVNSNA